MSGAIEPEEHEETHERFQAVVEAAVDRERQKLQSRLEELADEVDLLTRMADLQRAVQAHDPLATTLQRIVDLADELLPRCEIGISLVGRSDMERAISTGPRAHELDARQRAAGEGPCIDSLGGIGVVRGRPEEWPCLADVDDVSEIVGVPMSTDGGVDGALNVYVRRGRLDDRSLHLLRQLARQGSVALDNARLVASSIALAASLERAMETRGVIEQAKGVLMARQGCGAEEAFDLLRRASQRENVKLHRVAARIVASASAAPGVTAPRPRS